MQWWCSAQTAAWNWDWRLYPGVWVFVAGLLVGRWLLARRLETRSTAAQERRQRSIVFFAGALTLWVALDWPLGALGAGYLASAHMLQFLLVALVAPPLLLYGSPPGFYDAIRRRHLVHRALYVLTHPLLAIIFFNVVLVTTHWPGVVDHLMVSQAGSLMLDMAWLVSGLVLWWPLVAPEPERPGFNYLYKVGYLILATILNTPAFAWLTFAEMPLYATYELAPPISGIPTRVDQQIAGLLMKVGGAAIFWTAITILFFRWYQSEERPGDALP
ncbi:MAG: cytochrome c oxidase assembly protein [Gemmatimonadales bacterium]|jgi:putative membrane protein